MKTFWKVFIQTIGQAEQSAPLAEQLTVNVL
jgi:hypothetical protein